jgi:hypothetical protein
MKMILDLFDDPTYSVTCLKDAGMTTFSASPNSTVAKGATVTLTVTPASNKELDEIEVIAGGVTITESSGTYSFTMGEANVTLYAKSKADNKYLVTEECKACLNGGAWTVLHKNTVVTCTPNGVQYSITAAGGGASVTVDAAIQNLIDQGILVKI